VTLESFGSLYIQRQSVRHGAECRWRRCSATHPDYCGLWYVRGGSSKVSRFRFGSSRLGQQRQARAGIPGPPPPAASQTSISRGQGNDSRGNGLFEFGLLKRACSQQFAIVLLTFTDQSLPRFRFLNMLSLPVTDYS